MKRRDIHGKEEQAREKGEFLEALRLAAEALIAYQEEGDYLGFAEVLQSQMLTLRHLYEKTGFRPYLNYALNSAKAAVEIAEEKGDKSGLVMPYHGIGKTYETMGNYEEAVKWHEKAAAVVDQLPSMHNREGYKAEIVGHLYSARLMTGDRSAYDRFLEQIERLKNSDESKFNKDAWLSGMYMSAAEGLYKLGEKEKAEVHMTQAKEIIDGNPELKLRREQWEKLARSFR